MDGDGFAGEDLLLAQGVEDCYASAELRGKFNGVNIAGNANYCFCAEGDVLAVAAVPGNTVYGFIVAHLGEAAAAGLAGVWKTWWLIG